MNRLKTLFFGAFTAFQLCVASTMLAYPLDLNPYGPIQTSGSDAPSSAFNSYYNSTIAPYIVSTTNGSGVFSPVSDAQVTVLPSSNTLNFPSNAYIRFYFISSSAAYHNTLGMQSNGTYSLSPGDQALIFPNTSPTTSAVNPLDPNSPYPGLNAGDFVDLGEFAANTSFNFFIGANGANVTPPYDVFWNDPSQNPLNSNQALTVQFNGTNYYLISWEDTLANSGDGDFNDTFVVAEIVTPEPQTYVLLASLLGLVCFARGFAAKRKVVG